MASLGSRFPSIAAGCAGRWPLALALISVLGAGVAAGASSRPPPLGTEALLVFFDPDANHQAIASITSSFNRFLRQVDPGLSFQAVQSRERLRGLLKEPRVVLAFVSAGFVATARAPRLRPVLVPASQGDITLRKVLYHVGRARGRNLNGLRIAASASHQDPRQASDQILRQLRTLGIETEGSIAIPVAKDIDALLALSFAQVDAALVTATSVAVLRRINPGALETFEAVLETSSLRSPLCMVADRLSPEREAHLIQEIRAMNKHPDGRRAMLSLGFTEWVTFEEGMLE